MRKICSPFLGLPMAALAVVGLSLGSQDPAPANLSGVIGVVNALQVFNAYPKAIAGKANLEEMAQQFNELARQREQDIQQLQLDLMALDTGAVALDQRLQKTLELDLAQRGLQGQIQLHETRLQREMAVFNMAMYKDIWEATTKVAKAKSLKLVLRMRELEPPITLQNERNFNDRRTVLYVAPELDLTQDVINMLK